jgi:hypothetical protein
MREKPERTVNGGWSVGLGLSLCFLISAIPSTVTAGLLPLSVEPVSAEARFRTPPFSIHTPELVDVGVDAASLNTPFSFDNPSFFGTVDMSVAVGPNIVDMSLSSETTNTGSFSLTSPEYFFAVTLLIDVPVLGGPLTPIAIRSNPGVTTVIHDGSEMLVTDISGPRVEVSSSFLDGLRVHFHGDEQKDSFGNDVSVFNALAGDTLTVGVTFEVERIRGVDPGKTLAVTNDTAFVDFRTSPLLVLEPNTFALLACSFGAILIARRRMI